MVNELKTTKKKVGRPKGASGRTLHPLTLISREIEKSLDILHERGKSLAHCLADEMENGKTSQVLTAVARFLPQRIDLSVDGSNNFIKSLKEINERMDNIKTIDHIDTNNDKS